MKPKQVIVKFTRSYEISIEEIRKYWESTGRKNLDNFTETDLKNGAEAVALNHLNSEVDFFTQFMENFVGCSTQIIYE